jgi:hypothetical protein
MGKRILSWRQQRRVKSQPRAEVPQCPRCGMIKSDASAAFLIDQLFQSNTELCTTLRSAGRQMLRFEDQDDAVLEKIRKVLKRADHVRQMLNGAEQSPEAIVAHNEETATSVPAYAAERAGIEGSAARAAFE